MGRPYGYVKGRSIPVTVVEESMVIAHQGRGGDHRVSRRGTDDEIGKAKNQVEESKSANERVRDIYVAMDKLRNSRFTHNERVSRIH